MSINRELAAHFDMLASLMEISGANAFKVNANRTVVRVLESLDDDVAQLAAAGTLEKVDGIGKGTATKIRAFIETGSIPELDALQRELPEGLISLLDISGLGPKTIGRLWRDADVVDRASLRTAIEDGRLASLPRMGAKTIANISDSLDFAEQSADRTPIGVAHPLASALVDALGAVPGVQRIMWAGSLRRGCETIGDIDILAVADTPADLIEAFTSRDDVLKVLVAGDTKASVRLDAGMQVDLRVVPDDCWGATCMYFTGSKEHNIELRARAQSMGMRLNEYGLFPDDGDSTPPQDRGIAPVAAATEADIYAALELPLRDPARRESGIDITTADAPLIQVDDIGAELHAHTTASDGHLSIDELVDAARRRGMHTIAVTDHSVSSVQANGLSVDRLLAHVQAVHDARDRHPDMTLLAGSEVDIHADGTLDYDDDILAQLDIVVASPHASLKQDPAKATARLLAAIAHPLVHIIGHPTGRMIGRRPGLDPDMQALVQAAAACGTALEINANPRRLDLRDRDVRRAVAAGCLIAIDTDAHTDAHFDFLPYGVLTAQRGGLTATRCVNCLPADALLAWLADKASLAGACG